MALGLRKIAIICSFRSFSLHWMHILKWNLIHRFIMGISRSSSVLGMIKPFWTELWPLDFKKFQLFAVSVHFLCTGCTYWNEIWYTDLSWEYLGQVRFWVYSSHFGQSYGPWTSKNCNYLQFSFIFFALDAHIEMKFGIQIYCKNI
jgi:hypothetical protein